MRRQIQGLRALRERKAMADKALQIHLAIHDKTDGLLLQVDRRAIRPDQTLLIDADGCRIDHGLSMLRLRKKQYPPTRTGRIHRNTNEGVAADRENYRVGATSLRQFADALDLRLPAKHQL